MIRQLALCISLVLAFPATSYALTVNSDGSISCGRGKTVVFWEEDMGLPEDYRRILILNHEKLQPREYLLHSPLHDKSELLDELSGGTNIPWRGMSQRDGEAFGPYRFLRLATEKNSLYRGKSVDVVIVEMAVYWPVCALTPVVDQWYDAAPEELYVPSEDE